MGNMLFDFILHPAFVVFVLIALFAAVVALVIVYGVYGTGGAGGELSNKKTRLTMNRRYGTRSSTTEMRIAFNPAESCFCL